MLELSVARLQSLVKAIPSLSKAFSDSVLPLAELASDSASGFEPRLRHLLVVGSGRGYLTIISKMGF